MHRAKSTFASRDEAGTKGNVSAWRRCAALDPGTLLRALFAAPSIALTLAGCCAVSGATGGYLSVYSGPERPDPEVATISCHFAVFALPRSPIVEISEVDDSHTG